jgi:Kef-type K+ transport system membrane component KefB
LGNKLRINLLIKSSISGYALIICFLFAAIASIFDVNIIFGAFLAGIVVGLIPDQRFDSAKSNIKDISLAFFVPIYFAIVGLKLDLIRNLDLAFFLGFLALSTLIIIASTVIATKIIGKDWLSSLNLGIAMSTRGGPGIVLATVAFDLGIINENFFTALVLIAIVSSLISGYWFKLILSRGWKLIED